MNETDNFRGLDFAVHQSELEVHLVENWPDNAIKVTSTRKLEQDTWHHVAVSYDGSSKAEGVKLYIDGQPDKVKVHVDKLTGSYRSNEPVRIGSRSKGAYFSGRLDEIRIYQRVLDDEAINAIANEQQLAEFLRIAAIRPNERTVKEAASQIEFSIARDTDARDARSQLRSLKDKPPAVGRHTAMGLTHREAARSTHVHIRGDFLQKGTAVSSATPGFLHPLKTESSEPTRRDLARWLLDSENTFTPRVTVNRMWQQFFGRGIVESDQDFGSQGSPPTHPELLDWLATHFVRDGWSVKSLHRRIVCSATYRQSSVSRPELADRDPYNTWIAFRSRQRVQAEAVRDFALVASSLLDTRIGGPSVFPPLPPGIIELAFVDVINRGPWKVSNGGDRYRRGLYTFFQRTAPFPMLVLFDAPDSNTACTFRERSNTPLQALTLWNDPVFMEAARSLAMRIARESATVPDHDARFTDLLDRRIDYAWIVCFSRQPLTAERDDVRRLFGRNRTLLAENGGLREKLIGNASVPSDMAPDEFASWIAVARTMLNLDEFITRE